MLKVGSKFYTFDELSSRLEEFQDLEQVQLWVRDSRTVVAAAKRARRKSLNPALKYAELTYSCVFGGRRPSDQTKIHNQTSAGGCPFKVRLSTSIDGQALVVKEICHEHNHEPGKKLHEEPRRLYKKTQNRTAVRKPVRYIVNKQRVTSGTNKAKGRPEHTESHVQLGQSPFHHLQLHQQQYQQQQQLKLQLQQHLQQQQQQQQQLREKQAEVIQLDSPDHVDTPEHLSSPDLSTTFDQLGSLNNSVDQYTYLPPSPTSPSLSSGCPVDCEEEERLEPILDLEEALEEALGDLDSVGSMEVDANLRLTSSGSTASSLMSQSEAAAADDPAGPPPARRQRGRPRKQSFTGTPMKGERSEHDKDGGSKEEKSSDGEDFLGFSPSTDKVANKSETVVSKADILQASAMARQLHVYKPGIDFVPGARLEVLESRDNNWYQCKIVEVDWGELDILVHYERWSIRFDEWLKMDSTRIRSLSRSSQRRERKSGVFSVGDRVLARWSADGKRYQARVTKELGDDQYEVLFFDGVAKVLRSTALSKVDVKPGEGEEQRGNTSKQQQGTDDEDSLLMSPGATSASSTDSRSSSPEPEHSPLAPGRAEEFMEVETVTPVRKNIFDVEIIERKRKSKRKAAVEELFQSLKKRRKCESKIGTRTSVSSPRQQQQQQQGRPGQTRKVSFSKKKVHEAYSAPQDDSSVHQAATSSSEVADSSFLSQSPRIVSVEMPDGWKKCCSQRTHGTTAGKWDTFYLAPDGKKIRCKNDLNRYCEEYGVTCDIEKFDFSLKNMKEVIDAQADPKGTLRPHDEQEPEKESFTSQVSKESAAKSPLEESCGISKTGAGKKVDVKKSEMRHVEMVKHSDSPRMKLEIPLIPKAEHLGTFAPSQLGTSSVPWSPTTPSPLSRSLPASASASSEELLAKDAAGVSGYAPPESTVKMQREEVLTKTSVGVSGYVHSESSVKVQKDEVHSKDSVGLGGCAPPESSPESLPQPTATITPVRQRHVLTREPVLSEDMPTKTPLEVGEYLPPELSPESLPRPSTAPVRQRHVLKKEPVLAPNEFVVRAQHNEHQCPKGGCGKTFRKENLLQMHIKHYHPELLKKTSSWAPNVADLAYARTVGDHLDNSSSPSHSSPPADKPAKSEVGSKRHSRGVAPISLPDTRIKAGDKKTTGAMKTLTSSKDSKKKDKVKPEPEQGAHISEDETEPREEVEEYADDLADSPISVHMEDPDYMPCDDDTQQMRKDRKERRKSRDLKGKKKKLVPSESLSEDDQQDTKTVTKYRYSKRKGLSSSKANVPSSNGEPLGSEPSVLTSPSKKTQGTEAEAVSIDAEEDTGDAWVEGTESVPASEPSAEIINCGCGSTEEEGLMLQCDVCLCWQHGDCYNIVGEDQVPDKYICSLCDHPRLERSSHKFRHHQDWLKEGRLPRFSFSSTRGDLRLETCIRRGHELTANVLQLSQVLHSLHLKLHIAREADHPKFVMWHKKWDEQEEPSSQSKEETCMNPESVAPLQELMNIVEQDDSCLSAQMIDTKVTGQTSGLASTYEAVRPVTGKQDNLDNSHAIFPGSWEVSGAAVAQTQGANLQSNDSKDNMATKEGQNVMNTTAMDVIKHPGESTTNLSEVSEMECETSIGSPRKGEQKDKLSGVEDCRAPQGNEPEISLPSEKESQIAGIKFVELGEKGLQNKEENKDMVEIASATNTCEDSMQITPKEESSITEEKINDEINILNSNIERKTDSIKDKTAPISANDNEENLQSATRDQTKEASLHLSHKSILSCKESSDDLDHTEESTDDSMSMSVAEAEESKVKLPRENKVEPIKEEKSEGVLENKAKIQSQKTVKSENKEQEPCKDDKYLRKEDDSKIKHMDTSEGTIEDESNAVTDDNSNASKVLPKLEESDIATTESEDMNDKDQLKDPKTKDKEQEKVPESSNFAPTSMTPPGTAETLNEDETHLEDGDDLALDLSGLGATGEGGMPGGSELAALLSSQTELEQLVSQASSALAPVTGNVHSVQAPIIPEAERIEPVNCKLNLLEHVQAMQTSITHRFEQIEQQLEVLEAEMGLTADAGEDETEEESGEHDPATLQARALIKLVMNDLSVVKKIADFTH